MCVIIYVPKESVITEQEIRNAWNTNPHGAGYSIQTREKVFFKRGFMDINSFLKEVKPLIGKYNLLLHFRISTSKKVNKVQTHPYKKGNVSLTEGFTTNPVICMNGIISNQIEYKDCNDTMSYIVDHKEAFANINQDILNIIEEATGAKWAVMTPKQVLLSSKFEKEDGKFYSNKNHKWKTYFKSYNNKTRRVKKSFTNMIKNRGLRNSIRKNRELHEDLIDFIDTWCNNNGCNFCTKCLKNAKTLRDVKITLNENYYYIDIYDYDEEDNNEIVYDTCCCLDNKSNEFIDYDYCTWFDSLE